MIESKLMSYITSDYQTKSDMTVGHMEWQKIIEEMAPQFKEAGALRQTVSQIWNKEGVFRLGNLWEYRDEKAYNNCQELFKEAESLYKNRGCVLRKVFANRGVILEDLTF